MHLFTSQQQNTGKMKFLIQLQDAILPTHGKNEELLHTSDLAF